MSLKELVSDYLLENILKPTKKEKSHIPFIYIDSKFYWNILKL